MSSGDESDDGDLTEGSSCGSDISQWNEGTRSTMLFHWQTYLVYSKDDPAAKEHAPAFRYSKVSRHYGLHAGKPSSWVNSPVFTLRVWNHVPNTWDYY